MKPVIGCLTGMALFVASVGPLGAQGSQRAATPDVHEVKITRAEALSLIASAAQAGPSGPAAEGPQPLQVLITIARYQGEKRTSSLPFSLSTSSAPGSKANVRMGGSVAVPSTVFTPTAGGQVDGPKPLVSYNYQDVGTNIDVTTVPGTAAGRIGLNVTISETTLKPADPGAQGSVPGRNTYQSQNTVFVKDGETAHFTAATDRLTGEVVRIEVKATFVK
jgi:hypothetical protein